MYHSESSWYQLKICGCSEPRERLRQEFETAVIKHDRVIEWSSNSEISQIPVCKINLIMVLRPSLPLSTLPPSCTQPTSVYGFWTRICVEVTNAHRNDLL